MVNCSEEKFNHYYSISEEDISELIFILKNGNMPKKMIKEINGKISDILKNIKNSKKGR